MALTTLCGLPRRRPLRAEGQILGGFRAQHWGAAANRPHRTRSDPKAPLDPLRAEASLDLSLYESRSKGLRLSSWPVVDPAVAPGFWAGGPEEGLLCREPPALRQ